VLAKRLDLIFAKALSLAFTPWKNKSWFPNIYPAQFLCVCLKNTGLQQSLGGTQNQDYWQENFNKQIIRQTLQSYMASSYFFDKKNKKR